MLWTIPIIYKTEKVIWKGLVYFPFQETSPKTYVDANTENGNTFSSNYYQCLLIAVFMYRLSFSCNIYTSSVHLLIFILLSLRVLLYSSIQLEFRSLHCEELFTTLGKLVQDMTDFILIKLFIALSLNYFFFFFILFYPPGDIHRVLEWFGLEGILKIIQFQFLCINSTGFLFLCCTYLPHYFKIILGPLQHCWIRLLTKLFSSSILAFFIAFAVSLDSLLSVSM